MNGIWQTGNRMNNDYNFEFLYNLLKWDAIKPQYIEAVKLQMEVIRAVDELRGETQKELSKMTKRVDIAEQFTEFLNKNLPNKAAGLVKIRNLEARLDELEKEIEAQATNGWRKNILRDEMAKVYHELLVAKGIVEPLTVRITKGE